MLTSANNASARSCLGLASSAAALLCTLVLCSSCMVELSRTTRYDAFKPIDPEKDVRPLLPARKEHPDGTVTLITRLPDQLVANLRNCIALGESDLIFDQLLSDETKKTYTDRNLDPHEAVKWLMDNRRDVQILLTRMGNPMQDSSNVNWESSGPYIRFHIYTPIRLEMRFTTLEVIRENGQYRLLMIS